VEGIHSVCRPGECCFLSIANMREIDTDLNELICAGQDISEHWPLKTRESVKMLEKKVSF
jgi:hypothetical protein